MFRRHLTRTAAALALALLGHPPALHAQCFGCDGQVLGAAITNQANQGANDARRISNAQFDQGIRRGGRAAPAPVATRSTQVVMDILTPEYERRLAAQGKAGAQQWIKGAARRVGDEMGRLRPEYLRRVQAEGRARADDWYMAQARLAGQRQVAASRR